MAGLRTARRVEQRFGTRIASVLGLQGMPVTFNVVKGLSKSSEDGRLAQGYIGQGVVDIDRRFMRTADRADLRGALIHEIAHAYGAASETEADYARYMLNKNEAAYWQPSQEVLKMANQSGTNGPRPERTTGRFRDTLVNNASKAGVPAPPVSPASAYSAGNQLASSTFNYLQQLALLKQQSRLVKGGLRQDVADIRSQAIGNMAGAVNSSLDRGMLGSSVDMSGRSAVIAERASAIARARAAAQQEQLGLKQEAIGAAATYAQEQNAIYAAQAAERMAALQEAYANGLYDPAAAARASRTGLRPRTRTGVSDPTAGYGYPNLPRYGRKP